MTYNKILILSLLLAFPGISTAEQTKPKVLVSIPPIASLVSILLGEEADVEVIQKTSSCPHHHSLKPSEISAIAKADFIIYIDKKFESYLAPFLHSEKNSRARDRLINLASIKDLDLRNNNFHFWINNEYNIKIIRYLTDTLAKRGFNGEKLEANCKELESAIISTSRSYKIKNSIIVGESLAYLAKKDDEISTYYPKMTSLRNFHQILSESGVRKPRCIIIDQNNNIKFNDILVVKLDIENWNIGDIELRDYYFEYIDRINQIISACGG